METRGFSGGMWILWDRSRTWVLCLQKHGQFAHLPISHDQEEPWLLKSVYGSPNRSLVRTYGCTLKLWLVVSPNLSWLPEILTPLHLR